MSAPFPSGFFGDDYRDVVADISAKRDTGTYLEIGVDLGLLLMRVHCRHAIGVDPAFNLHHNIMTNKRKMTLFQMRSDAFFRDEAPRLRREGPVDLAFLDGLHAFEFLLRDFFNTEACCDPSSLIVLHDCLPLNEEMVLRNMAESVQASRDGAYPHYWTGDVWKVVPILQKYRPDLRLVFVDAPPTGLVLVTNLDPASTILKHRYLDIVDEFAAVPNKAEAIGAMYESIDIVPTARLTKDADLSLYVRA